MKTLNINSKKGFTIIEVVLVLAIAGLIFLMVFIALPNMQRSQRDTQRRNDYSTLNTNISNYMTNNNGKFPATCDGNAGTLSGICAQQSRYLNSTGEDPTGNTYKLSVKKLESASDTVDSLAVATTDAGSIVIVYQQADCSGTDSTTGYSKPAFKTGSRNFAIYGQLENGTYCMASQ